MKRIFFFIFLLISIINILCCKITDIHVHSLPKKTAYLTFDDGPSHNTLKILDILEKKKIQATFFIIGNKVNKKNYYILKRIIKNHNYIGLHTMTHEYSALYKEEESLQTFINEIKREQKLIYNITGIKSNLVRLPYSSRDIINDKYIEALIDLKLKLWDWNIDTEDWKVKTVDQILSKIEKDFNDAYTTDTLVILFHEKDLTVASLPIVIDYFKDRGYSFEVYDPKHHIPFNFRGIPNI